MAENVEIEPPLGDLVGLDIDGVGAVIELDPLPCSCILHDKSWRRHTDLLGLVEIDAILRGCFSGY